jgi:hypothetical protein
MHAMRIRCHDVCQQSIDVGHFGPASEVRAAFSDSPDRDVCAGIATARLLRTINIVDVVIDGTVADGTITFRARSERARRARDCCCTRGACGQPVV